MVSSSLEKAVRGQDSGRLPAESEQRVSLKILESRLNSSRLHL